MSVYLQESEYATFGLPGTTTAAQVTQASALIDGWLRRPEGLIYGVDYTGAQPAYMVGLNPTYSFQSSGSITAGLGNIVVPITATNYVAPSDIIGQPVVLDRANAGVCEVCVVTAIANNPARLTLQSFNNPSMGCVQNHAANCTMEFGLTIKEERSLPEKRSLTRVARPPLQIISGMGRYGYGTRLDQIKGLYAEFNLLATISEFGGPPQWEPFPIANVDSSIATHEIWVPAGLLLSYFSEVRLFYVSGFAAANLPIEVKIGCASIVTALQNNAAMGFTANINQIRAGTGSITRTITSAMGHDTREMLKEHRAKVNI
jgi:hypothetical protein